MQGVPRSLLKSETFIAVQRSSPSRSTRRLSQCCSVDWFPPDASPCSLLTGRELLEDRSREAKLLLGLLHARVAPRRRDQPRSLIYYSRRISLAKESICRTLRSSCTWMCHGPLLEWSSGWVASHEWGRIILASMFTFCVRPEALPGSSTLK